VLGLATALNLYDRNLINILIEDLKHDLSLSDAQVGVLVGPAFALVYSVASIPIARYADRGRRVLVLGASLTVWSIMTGICGFAAGFWSMLGARLGVGVGESGSAPTTQAIVAETFPPERRGTAFAFLALPGAMGMVAALAAGGVIAHRYGWRIAYVASAIPGIILALIMFLTIREPVESSLAERKPPIPFREALHRLGSSKSFVWTCGGLAIAGLGTYGGMAWYPTYLMRRFGLNSSEVGTTYSIAVGCGMLFGILLGGIVGDWLSKKDGRAPFFMLAFSFGIAGPLSIAFLLMNNYRAAVGLAFPMTLITMSYVAPTSAAIQAMSGPRYRATGAAIFLLVLNLIGQGLGPFTIGWLSDFLEPAYGKDSLRIALLTSSATCLVGVVAFLLASRTARADIRAANSYA
jgi:MFS family permease